jgi:hypothetical protein
MQCYRRSNVCNGLNSSCPNIVQGLRAGLVTFRGSRHLSTLYTSIIIDMVQFRKSEHFVYHSQCFIVVFNLFRAGSVCRQWRYYHLPVSRHVGFAQNSRFDVRSTIGNHSNYSFLSRPHEHISRDHCLGYS